MKYLVLIMKKIFIIAFFIIFSLGLSIITVANALTISPPVMEIDANPGEIIKKQIKIFVEVEAEGIYYPSVANFIARGEEGESGFLEQEKAEEAKGYSLANWIEIDKTPIGLKKNERAEISFIIKVPKDAEPGGHYGVIFLSTQPPALEKEQVAIGVTGKLGSLILVRVAGEIKEQGNLLEFNTADKKNSYNRLPIEFITRFENTGNVHLKPQGEIKISNIFGKTIAKVSVNEKGGNVLPESIRKFKSIWEKKDTVFEKGKGFFAELKKEKDNFAFGKYKAELILVGFDGGIKSFWIFPWRIVLVSLIVLIVLIIVLGVLIKLYNKRLIQKYQSKKEV